MTYRVIQWTTGNVGLRTLRAIIASPIYELVGVYAYSPSKAGTDAAELAGLDTPTGVKASNDIDALIALKPDACCYTPQFPDFDDLVRLLEGGVNVVTTAAIITGMHYGQRERLNAAGIKGNASLYGSGMNPGFANILAQTLTQVCDRVDQVRVVEAVDCTDYDSWETEIKVGYGKALDDPTIVPEAKEATSVFSDAVEVMAEGLGVKLDEITFDMDVYPATEDNDLGYAFIPKGTVTAVDARWRGWHNGKDLIVLRTQWLKGKNWNNDFEVRHGYLMEVDGRPTIRNHMMLMPPPDWDEPSFMGFGMIITGMPALNAIPGVVAARPGVVSFNDIPSISAKGYA
ncbi:MAG: hypothetical protein KDE25_09835 [Novosphingobium sp.]|nr:hypothetical protein [Novosphingobium sp.]